ncbi:putative phage abortive infection protein [Chromobacterium sinusclupearum]|nr:putative phage abortive infection protein [Chromobacterium sinusclupearum]
MKKNHFQIMLILCFIAYIAFPRIFNSLMNEFPIKFISTTIEVKKQLHDQNQVTIDNMGQLGSSFGGLNTFLTAISLFILGVSLIYQTWQYSEQQKANNIRDVENNFFKLVDHIRNTVHSIDITQPNGNKFYGSEAFSKMVDAMRLVDREIRKKSPSGYKSSIEKKITEYRKKNQPCQGTYRLLTSLDKALKKLKLEDSQRQSLFINCHKISFLTVYFKYEHDLAHYFRLIYRTIYYIDSKEINYEIKLELISLLRASLSASELILFFYNVLSPSGLKFVKFAEKYAFFDNLDPDDLMASDHKKLLPEEAFSTDLAMKKFNELNSIKNKILNYRHDMGG